MAQKDVKFVNGGRPLEWDAGSGFAVNPQDDTAVFGADFLNIVMTLVGTGTVIVYGSTQKDPPDFTSASTITNSFAPVVLADYSLVNTYYAGATGATVAGATRIVELNTNVLTWIGIHRSANTVDVLLTETNNV